MLNQNFFQIMKSRDSLLFGYRKGEHHFFPNLFLEGMFHGNEIKFSFT
jgi:hypothetical protein